MSSTDDLTLKTTVSPDLETAARKYAVPETTATTVSTTTNNDSIVVAAAGLRTLSIALSTLAQQAAQDVASARDAINNASDLMTSGSTHRQTSEADVVQNQERLVNLSRPGLPRLSSYSLNDSLGKTLGDLVSSSRHLLMPITKPGAVNVENKITPDIDQVSLELKRGKGVSDAFFARVTFSVPVENIDNGDVKSLRVFRSDVIGAIFARPLNNLSLRGMGIISSLPLTYRSKNDDTLSMFEHRLNIDNIQNELSSRNPFDRFVKQRVVANSTEISSLDGIDAGVAENIQFIEARRLQDPSYGSYQVEDAVVVGRINQTNSALGSAHLDDLNTKTSKFQFVVNKNNNAKFRQVFAATPSGFSAKKIGDRYYYTYDDNSVMFGRQYQYYVVSVNKHMVQSNRSSIVSVDIDGLRVPPRPKAVVVKSDGVFATLVASVDDQLVEKFEVWKKDEVASQTKRQISLKTVDNGFSLVAEMLSSEQESGANWIDKFVIPGHSYVYRVYSIDIFGNKSETPFEVRVTIPNKFEAVNSNLTTPSILAEVDSKTQKIKITIYCRDENVKKIRLERRDLTIDQHNFVVPTESARTVLGQFSLKHSSFAHGERIQDGDNSTWTGYFDNENGKIDFIDRLVSFDRTYQYRVYGVDDVGNRSSYDYSRPVLVSRRPMINTPVNLSSEFVTGSAGEVKGVRVKWNASSLDVSAEDKFGSQFDLADTSVRTLYQLERQKNGERWLSFNLTDRTEYLDPVVGAVGDNAPEYRPPYLELNNTYQYRLQAVLSGGYISNKTDQLSVFVSNNIIPPQDFILKTPDPRVRPFYIMLNWNTSDSSGVVDYWEIERAEVNNFAAARINLRNTEDFKKLNFTPFREVFREASRFRSYQAEKNHPTTRSSVIVGDHHFMDTQVLMGNTYFYKIRAVDTRGNKSDAIYRGMKLTHASYERMIDGVLSETDKAMLAQNYIPARTSMNIVSESPKNTMGLNPGFSAPRTVLQIVPKDGKG